MTAARRATETTSRRSEVEADEVTGTGIRYEMADGRGQNGQTESRGTTTTKGEEADAEVRSMTSEGRITKHAPRSAEGQEASMHPEGPQRVTKVNGRVGPLRGEYEEEDDNDES